MTHQPAPDLEPTAPAAAEPAAESVVESPPQPLPPANPRRFTTRRILIAAGFVVIALVTALSLVALALTQAQPRWWKPFDPSDSRTIATAEAVENGIATALTQVRQPAPNSRTAAPDSALPTAKSWRVFITTDQANAWLNIRLKRWLNDQIEQGRIGPGFKWPPEVGQVQVRFADGRIHIGARVTRDAGASPPAEQTLAAALRPQFHDDGSFWLLAETVSIGRLALPAGWVLPSSSSGAARGEAVADIGALPQTQRVLNALEGHAPVLSNPVIKLADGRRVRLLEIEAQSDRLVITCQTEPNPPPAPAAPTPTTPSDSPPR